MSKIDNGSVQSGMSKSFDSFSKKTKQKKPKNKSLSSIAFTSKNDDAIVVEDSDINGN